MTCRGILQIVEGLHGEFTDRQVVLKLRQLGFNVNRSSMKPAYVPGFSAEDEARLLDSWERHYNKKGYFPLDLLPALSSQRKL